MQRDPAKNYYDGERGEERGANVENQKWNIRIRKKLAS